MLSAVGAPIGEIRADAYRIRPSCASIGLSCVGSAAAHDAAVKLKPTSHNVENKCAALRRAG